MAIILHLEDTGAPQKLSKRKLGALNHGFYCEACGEFCALGVFPHGANANEYKTTSDGTVLFKCFSCGHEQRMEAAQLVTLKLTESNKRKPVASRH